MIKKKALEPLIASILLIVVAVILVTIVLSWGKEFSTKSVSTTNSLVNYDVLSDKQSFMRFVDAKNGMYTFDYYPPNTGNVNFKVVGYSLLGYNDFIPLEPEKEITHAGKFMLPLGIINQEPITISLLLEDGSYLTFKNIKNINLSPSQSDCPSGFVPVPGNHLYGTVGSKGGFCVMQYEAKIDETGDGIGDENTTCKYSSSYSTWNDYNSAVGCSYTLNNRQIVSSAQGYPLTDINQTDSHLACQSIGGHLITNEEWMTLARNIEIVPSNWSSGTVGQGSLKRGNTGDAVVNVSYDGVDPESGTSRNQLAMLKLTNGSEVWDFSGNIYEWVGTTISSDDLSPAYDGENLGNDEEYSTYFRTADNNFGSIGYKGNFLLNSDYNSENGVGRTWGCTTECNNGEEYIIGFLRGGACYSETDAGVLYLTAGIGPSFTDTPLGFRCVVVPE